jgi:hypothetical protein
VSGEGFIKALAVRFGVVVVENKQVFIEWKKASLKSRQFGIIDAPNGMSLKKKHYSKRYQ